MPTYLLIAVLLPLFAGMEQPTAEQPTDRPTHGEVNSPMFGPVDIWGTTTACRDRPPRRRGERDVREHEPVIGHRATPDDIHVSFAETDASRTLSFVWLTGSETFSSEVRLGPSPDSLRATVNGWNFTISDLRHHHPTRRIHEVRVCDLPPDTEVYYQVGGEGAWSEVHSVRTAPEANSDREVRFVLGGDNRGNAPVWGEMAALIQAEGADFVLIDGDLVGNGHNQDLWDLFFNVADGLFRDTPLIPVIGNHERNAINYDALFSTPGDGRNFVLRYGDIAFVVFDDNYTPEDIESVVRPRVAELLEQAADARWLILVNHRPIYSASHYGSNRHLQAHILELIDEYEVDLVVNGHNHLYERSVPIRDGQPADGGTTYLVTGGLGSPLYEAGEAWFTAAARSDFHYVRVVAQGNEMHFEAVLRDGEVFDRFTLRARRGEQERSSQPH